MNRYRLIVGTVVAGGAALAALVPGSSAVGQQSPPAAVVDVELQNTARLQTRGAVAQVLVELTCTPGAAAFVSVELTQRSGGRIARGFGHATSVCDGTIQELTIPVTASEAPFKQGSAFAEAFADACVLYQDCVTGTDAEEITLTKKS